MVHLHDVTMTYRASGTKAANGLNLDINEGEFVFLVGPSGSGKTTIIKLLTGEVSADAGEIEVNGFNLRAMRRRRLPRLRRTLGVIFQDFRLIDNKSVYENVAFAMHVVGASRREIRERVPYVLKLVGLEAIALQRTRYVLPTCSMLPQTQLHSRFIGKKELIRT